MTFSIARAGLLSVLLSSFGFSLVPFAGPSKFFITSNFALVLDVGDPATLTVLGLLVARALLFVFYSYFERTTFRALECKPRSKGCPPFEAAFRTYGVNNFLLKR